MNNKQARKLALIQAKLDQLESWQANPENAGNEEVGGVVRVAIRALLSQKLRIVQNATIELAFIHIEKVGKPALGEG